MRPGLALLTRKMSTPNLLLLSMAALTACPPSSGDSAAGKDSAPPTGTDYEPGCILVDGGGGYAKLEDAVTVAGEGATITLCDGEIEAEIVLEKTVILEGSSPDLVKLVGPTGETPVTFKAGGGLRNVTISSSYNGVDIEGGSDVIIENVVFGDMPNRAIDAADSVNLQVIGCTFNAPGAGGVRVKGGSATISGSVFEAPGAAAIIGDGATLVVSGNQFNNVEQTARNDGFALDLTETQLTASDNVYTTCEEGGIKADGGEIVLSGESFVGTPIGIIAENAPFEAADISITDAATLGMYVNAPVGLINLQNVTVSIGAGLSCSNNYSSTSIVECGGVSLVGADGITVDGLSVSGYENFGAQIYSADAANNGGEADVPVSLSNLSFQDNGRTGLTLAYTSGTATNLSVSGLREPEVDPLYICFDETYQVYIGRSTGVLVTGGNMTLDAATFTNNDGWDTFAFDGAMTITGSTFDGSTCAGIMNAVGAVSVSGSTFTHANLANIYDIQGVTELTGNTFTANQDAVEVSFYETTTPDGHVTRNETDYAKVWDVIASASQSVVARDNVFETGGAGLQLYGVASAEVVGNSWTDYRSTVLYSYQIPDLTFAENVLDQVAGPLLVAYDSQVSVSDIDVGALIPVELPNRVYYDGVLIATMTTHAVGGGFQFAQYDETITSRLELSDVSIETLTGYGVYFSDGSVEIDNLYILDSAGEDVYGGIYGYAFYAPLDVDIEGADLGDVAGYGIYTTSYSGEGGTVVLNDVNLGDVEYYGVYSYGNTYVALDQVNVGSAGYYGVYASTSEEGATFSMTDSVISGSGTLSTGYAGVYLSGGTVTLTGNEVSNAASDGISLYGATVDIQDNLSTANTGFGMVCSSLTFTACLNNDLAGNGSGEQSGCDECTLR